MITYFNDSSVLLVEMNKNFSFKISMLYQHIPKCNIETYNSFQTWDLVKISVFNGILAVLELNQNKDGI